MIKRLLFIGLLISICCHAIAIEPIFSIFDDDTMDKYILSSYASTNPNWIGGYASIYFPLLHSAGVKGCLSAEGQRMGFTDTPIQLNYNGQVVKKMQDDFGWEVSCHTMTARYVRLTYEVNGLSSSLAQQILSESTNWDDYQSMSTTIVYDQQTQSNYYASKDKTQWLPVPKEYIRPYLMDYASNKVARFNPSFPIDYQWKRYLEIADSLGFCVETGVYPANTGSHAICPHVAEFMPYTFDITKDISSINTPPLTTCATRFQLDVSGGEIATDNAYHAIELQQWKTLIDETVQTNGWIVFFMHAYRPCWNNCISSQLRSNGGTYPDEWVHPILDTDTILAALDTPPARLGISNWSEWYPCPGTRLAMVHELFAYAKQKGIRNVIAQEGFSIFGNTYSTGMFTKGGQTGQDMYGILGTAYNYPHCVIGVDNTEDFWGLDREAIDKINQLALAGRYKIYTLDGRQHDQMRCGFYIIRSEANASYKICIRN